jgi:endonuclease III
MNAPPRASQGLSVLHPEVTSRNVELRNELLSNCGAGVSNILDSVFSTMMSQNTTDKNAHAAFANLKAAHPTWGTVMTAPPSDIAGLIKCAGLSEIRTQRMQMILATLSSEQNDADEPSMEYLREMDNDAVKKVRMDENNGNNIVKIIIRRT